MNTVFLLLAAYNSPQIPLEKVCDLFGFSPKEAAIRAARQALPIPCFRLGSQKSPWLVNVQDLADHLDKQSEAARREWLALRDAA